MTPPASAAAPGGGAAEVPVAARADSAVSAGLRRIGDHHVSHFRLAGGKHHGAIGTAGATAVERAVRLAVDLQIPLLGELDTSGAELHEGPAALHAWGRLAHALVRASGTVPTVAVVSGACVSGPALALGIFDAVLMTPDAFAYVSGPDAVAEFTGVHVDRVALGGAGVHDGETGVAALVVADERDALLAAETILDFLPPHHLAEPPRVDSTDPAARACEAAAAAVPARSSASYDVREVVDDVLDSGTFLELRPSYAPNLVIGFGRLDGRSVGVVANQPRRRAGTLDIEASRKAARFVRWCDAFNVPLLTFVDTPGFEPGRDLEWRGMIRHGAELVHAYAAASVPRLAVVLRKAYGGAYIVMDSRGMGNDFYVAWPGAEIAVMGAAGAARVLHGKRLRELSPDEAAREEARLVAEYEAAFANPFRAAERGQVDAVLEPRDTRRVLAAALDTLAAKRTFPPARKHSNSPL